MHGPSHGGSSSFSGGGSSGGSFSFDSGSGGSYSSGGYRGPRTIVFFGRTFYVSRPIFSFFIFGLVAIFVAVMVIVQTANQMSDCRTQIRYMDEDEVEWHQIIETAKKEEDDDCFLFTVNIDSSFIPSQGVFADGYTYYGYSYKKNDANGNTTAWIVLNFCLEYDGLDYYQVFFSFVDDFGKTITDITYAQYSENQIANIDHLTFAYKLLDNDVYAINADYDKTKCMEYNQYKEDYSDSKTGLIVASIIGGVLLLALALLVVFAIKNSKKNQELSEKKNQAEVDKLNAETESIKAETKKKNRKCAYCGSDIPEDATSCPNCGSGITKE